MKFEEFKEKVEGWAQVRGIYDQSTEEKQVDKFFEEFDEYLDAETELQEADAIGDMAVCIINASKIRAGYFPEWIPGTDNIVSLGSGSRCVQLGAYATAMFSLKAHCTNWHHSFEDCLTMAWNEIKDRKGMMIDGLFVKWENLTTEEKNELQSRLDAHIEADC